VTYQAYAQDQFRAQVGDPTLELPVDAS